MAKITHEGEITLGDRTFPFYVLDNGEKVISAEALGPDVEAMIEEALLPPQPQEPLSSFNQKLKQALDFDPKKG